MTRRIKKCLTVVLLSFILVNIILRGILVSVVIEPKRRHLSRTLGDMELVKRNISFDVNPNLEINYQVAHDNQSLKRSKRDVHINETFVSKNVTVEARTLKSETWHKQKKFYMDVNEIQNLFENIKTTKDISCSALFDNHKATLQAAHAKMMFNPRQRLTNQMYKTMAANCPFFRKSRGYIDSPVSEEENQFPLAYSILGYKKIEAIERLLRAIYRPQNYYCIHMDVKTKPDDFATIKSIANCFENVFLSSVSLDVRWGQFTVLESELVCMRDVWKYPGWKYFINLTGQEMPLKTNWEIVKILKAMKWANLVDGTWIRAKSNYFYRWTKANSRPPYNLRPIKGSVHIAVNRDFVDFALHDYRSKAFRAWLNKTEIPDESFFSTLNHNPQLEIPGSFLGEPEEYPKKPTFTRYKNWELGHGTWVRMCGGDYIRNICILGVDDLHRMKDDIGLFANKIYLDEQYYVYDCLEEMIFNRTREQYLGRDEIDTSFYEALDWVKLRLVL